MPRGRRSHADAFGGAPRERRVRRRPATPDTTSDDTDSDEEELPLAVPQAPVPLPGPERTWQFTDEQREVIDTFVNGTRNIYCTGAAGCGKSAVQKEITRLCRAKGLEVAVTAPSGKAAGDTGGETTWRFARWRPDDMRKGIEQLEVEVMSRHSLKRLQEVDVLIIDEISMVENWFLVRLDRILKCARGNEEFFGGIQTLVTGDFFQLPPVRPFLHCWKDGRIMRHVLRDTKYECEEHGLVLDTQKWAFQAPCWEQADFLPVNLQQVHRQIDRPLLAMLEQWRFGGRFTPEQFRLLREHQCDVEGAVRLASMRDTVKAFNQEQFDNLPGRKRTYHAVDYFRHNHQHLDLQGKGARDEDNMILALNEKHRYEGKLNLKKGMLVILTRNLDVRKGLVNGSQGTIINFIGFDRVALPNINDRDNERSLGESDRRERMATDGANNSGGGLGLMMQRQTKLFMKHPKNPNVWPVVRFLNGQEVAITADCAYEALGRGDPPTILARTQIPLMQGDCITIHRAQGATFEKVIVDCSDIFEEGQLYTAISRARSLHGLKVENLDENSLVAGANKEVKEHYRETFGI